MRLIALCLLWMGVLSAGTLRHCYATWEEDPTHSIALHFQGVETGETLTLYYDTHPHFSMLKDYPHRVSIPLYKRLGSRRIYHIPLRDLCPSTTYYFTLTDGNQTLSPERSFRTLATEPPYRIVEGGDWENTPEALQLAQVAASYAPQAVWLGGDYPMGVSSRRDLGRWDEWLDTYTQIFVGEEGQLVPLVMAIGNHEVVGGFGQTKQQAPFFFDFFRPGQESYFSLGIGENFRLFVLDSGHANAHGGAQKQWLENELKTYQAIPTKIALYHVPLYPSVRFTKKHLLYHMLTSCLKTIGVKRAATRLFSHSSLWGQTHWLPLFDAYALTVAFEHHDQALKRTHLLKGGERNAQGTLYLGDGGFGCQIQKTPIHGYLNPLIAKAKGGAPFFWLVDLEKEGIYFKALSLDHKILDKFYLNKN